MTSSSKSLAIKFGIIAGSLLAALPVIIFATFGSNSIIIGHQYSDVYTVIQEMDWVYRSIVEEGRLPLSTELINYPQTGPLFPPRLWMSLFAITIRPIAGIAGAYNWTVWIFYALGFAGMFLLGRKLSQSNLGGVVAAGCYGFSPFVLGYALASGSPEYLGTNLLPLGMYYAILASEDSKWGHTIIAGFVLGIVLSFSAYVAVMATMFLFIISVTLLIIALLNWSKNKTEMGSFSFSNLQKPTLALLIAIILALGPNLALIKSMQAPDAVVAADRLQHSVNFPPIIQPHNIAALADYFQPSMVKTDWISLFLKPVNLTYGLLVLVIAGLFFCKYKYRWLLAGGALLFGLLSTGPYIVFTKPIHGPGLINPFYWAAYHFFPMFDKFAEPFRLFQIVSIFACCLGALGAAALVRRWRHLGMTVALLLMAASIIESAIMVGPYLAPAKQAVLPPSEATILAAQKSQGAVMELPIFNPNNPGTMRRDRFGNQPFHRRPLVDNVNATFPIPVAQNGLLAPLIQLEYPDLITSIDGDPAKGRNELSRIGIDLLIIDQCLYKKGKNNLWLNAKAIMDHADLVLEEVNDCISIARIKQ